MCAYGVSEWNCALFTGGSTNGHCKWQVPVSTWVNPNMTEDWDKGIIITTTLTLIFVWIEKTRYDMLLSELQRCFAYLKSGIDLLI